MEAQFCEIGWTKLLEPNQFLNLSYVEKWTNMVFTPQDF